MKVQRTGMFILIFRVFFTTIILISDYSLPENLSMGMCHHGKLDHNHQEEDEPDRPNFGMSPAEFRNLWQGMVSSGVSNAKLLHFM